MTCREVIEFLMAYLDGEVSPAQRAEFERHLAVCPSCMRYMKQYMETVKLGKAAFTGDSPAAGAVPEGLIQAILAARRKAGG